MTSAECIEELRRIIADALLQTTAFITFYEPEVLVELEVAHRRYPIFMRAAEDAHLGHAVVLLYSLQETRPDTANFPQLGRLIEAETSKAIAEIPRLTALLEEARPLWQKVCTIRNQVFGHRSAARTRDECFSQASITPIDLLELAQIYERAVNAATDFLGQPGWQPLMDVRPDLRRVIGVLGAPRDE